MPTISQSPRCLPALLAMVALGASMAARAGEALTFAQPMMADPGARTVVVQLQDAMRFQPAEIEVKQGEVVTLELRNTGVVKHELVLADSTQELMEHAQAMMTQPDAPMTEPNQIMVKPGAVVRSTWRFVKPGRYPFGCTVPGHYPAGMHGTLVVKG